MFGALVALLIVAMVAGVMIGSVSVGPAEVFRVLARRGGLPVGQADRATDTIVWLIRAHARRARRDRRCRPGDVRGDTAVSRAESHRRSLSVGHLVGGGGRCGAGPVVRRVRVTGDLRPLGGGVHRRALLAAAAVLAMSRRRGAMSPLRIILAGTAISYACSAVSSLLIYRSRHAETAPTVLFWLLGSLAGASWSKLALVGPIVLVGVVILWACGRQLNALLAGDDTAAALGIDVARVRQRFLIVAALMTASVVAVSGAIGFVGLLLPHVGRFLVGNDHRRLLPVCALLGASFLVLVDIVARTIASPEEIPIGVITALIGTPFFLWFLARADRQGMAGSP